MHRLQCNSSITNAMESWHREFFAIWQAVFGMGRNAHMRSFAYSALFYKPNCVGQGHCSPPGRLEMPRQPVRIPAVVHPCSLAHGGALPGRAAGMPSRWGHAARRGPPRGGPPHGHCHRCGSRTGLSLVRSRTPLSVSRTSHFLNCNSLIFLRVGSSPL